MFSFHFNGEIVRHIDHDVIKAHIQERNSSQGRCKFGIRQISCYEYIKSAVSVCRDHGSTPETCPLACSSLCPEHRKRKDAGNKEKTYTIDWRSYRKISSAAHYMLKESKFRTLFLTLTFPKFKNDEITDKQANQCFSKFAENLRKNYDCSHYVAVKERGENTNRIHFHLLASFPFADFRRINRAWISAISDYCESSNRAVYTDKKARFIKSPRAAARYVCKYFNKSFGVKNSTRVIFISNSALTPPVKIKESYERIPEIRNFKYVMKKYDHVTVFKIRSDKEYDNFCNNFLYPLFECSLNNRSFYYLPP